LSDRAVADNKLALDAFDLEFTGFDTTEFDLLIDGLTKCRTMLWTTIAPARRCSARLLPVSLSDPRDRGRGRPRARRPLPLWGE
jgi:hypothetical protein